MKYVTIILVLLEFALLMMKEDSSVTVKVHSILERDVKLVFFKYHLYQY